ncbi:MAG: hypothetical protein DRO05_03140 [Thermoproteota archaeon]|nr:MAG: hypothetical protein DRO05_03140 [Candidatus Korarchaeota archaeon]
MFERVGKVMRARPTEIIERVVKKIAPGRAPSFREAHVIKALIVIDDLGCIGRARLSKILNLTEGETRTLLKHLKNENLISTSKRGARLTKKGENLLKDLRQRIGDYVSVPRSSLTVGPSNVAILLKDAASAIRYGLEQFYEALKVGAMGATTLVFTRGELRIPGTGERVVEFDKEACEKLIEIFKPKEGDVIVICSGDDRETAELGVLSIAFQILKYISSEGRPSSG